ncbi:hypothetical protein HDU84_004561 [Entophlyctis sp. JEL0112]|nr:hypothetical protein HDU84_004561 [Entophlyctis sp. JEL0112]
MWTVVAGLRNRRPGAPAAVRGRNNGVRAGSTARPKFRPERKKPAPLWLVAAVFSVVVLQLVFAIFVIRKFAYPPPSEHYLVFNATLYTSAESATTPLEMRPDAFVVGSDGRFEAIGSSDEMKSRYWHLKQYNMNRRTIVPGLTDSHAHIIQQGLATMRADVTGAKSTKDVVARLVRYLNANPDIERAAASGSNTKWLLGFGWDQTLWPNAEFPNKTLLDSHPRLKSIPVLLWRVDLHAVWCNSRALELSDVPIDDNDGNSQIIRDKHGDPTGVFLDAAMDYVVRVVPPTTIEESEKAVEVAADMMVRKGLTGVHDAALSLEDIQMFKKLIDNGKLPVRIYGMIFCDPPQKCLDLPLLPDRIMNGYKHGLLTVRAVKLVMDGALGSWGAAMVEPYADDKTKSGFLLMSAVDVRNMLTWGYQANVHCIGDLANKVVLDAFEAIAGSYDAAAPHLVVEQDVQREFGEDASSSTTGLEWMRSLRNRIEHAQILREEDLPRFARLGIVPSIQPVHATSDMGYATRRLGPDRVKNAYVQRRFLQQYAVPHIALGSDFPVESLDPMKGIYAATTRKWPNGSSPDGDEVGWQSHECLTRAEALKGFTESAAYASFQEKDLGTIAVGKWADFVVYEHDWVREEEDGGYVGESGLLEISPVATVLIATQIKSRTMDIVSDQHSQVVPWRQDRYYGATSDAAAVSTCSDTDVAVLDYWPTYSAGCSARSCAVGDYGYSSSVCVESSAADHLPEYTAFTFGPGVSYAELKFYNTEVCGAELSRITHYVLGQCVASSSSGDNSNSYQIAYDSSTYSLHNYRYSDSSCTVYNSSASFPMYLFQNCTASKIFGQYYTANVVTIANNTMSNPYGASAKASLSAGAIAGIAIASLLVVIAVALVLMYRRGFFSRKPPVAGAAATRWSHLSGAAFLPQNRSSTPAGDAVSNTGPEPSPSVVNQYAHMHHSVSASPGFAHSLLAPPLAAADLTAGGNGNPSVFSRPTVTSVSTFDTDMALRGRLQTVDSNNSNSNSNHSGSTANSSSKLASLFDGVQQFGAVIATERENAAFHERLELVELKLPSDPREWTVEQAARWAASAGVVDEPKCLEVMTREEIDGSALVVISEHQLLRLLGVTLVGRQAKLIDKLAKLKTLAQHQHQQDNSGAAAHSNRMSIASAAPADAGLWLAASPSTDTLAAPPPAYETTGWNARGSRGGNGDAADHADGSRPVSAALEYKA